MNRFEEINASYLQHDLSLDFPGEHADLLLSIGVYHKPLYIQYKFGLHNVWVRGLMVRRYISESCQIWTENL